MAMPERPVGIYSAGLGRREMHHPVIVAGIQSVYSKADIMGAVGLVIVDEAHLIRTDQEGIYNRLFRELPPGFRVVGFTATPYRLDSGSIIGKDKLFSDLAYEIKIPELIRLGYLCPLKSKSGLVHANLTNVHIRAGEYAADEMETAFNNLLLSANIIKELKTIGADRKSWLVFCSGIEHATEFTKQLRAEGLDAECITGESPPILRDEGIRRFKDGRLRILVNCDVLTTGFDSPRVDLIAVLRATQSVGLFVQICGRGCRLFEGKKDCLILDYGQNLERHGPIDQVKVRKFWSATKEEDLYVVDKEPGKTCPECRSIVPDGIYQCADCGFTFDRQRNPKVTPEASTAAVLSTDIVPETIGVDRVEYSIHEKIGSPNSLRVDYVTESLNGIRTKAISEWVCVEHEGFARNKAIEWWRKRSTTPDLSCPTTVEEAIERSTELLEVNQIVVKKEGKFYRVLEARNHYEEPWHLMF